MEVSIEIVTGERTFMYTQLTNLKICNISLDMGEQILLVIQDISNSCEESFDDIDNSLESGYRK